MMTVGLGGMTGNGLMVAGLHPVCATRGGPVAAWQARRVLMRSTASDNAVDGRKAMG